MPGALRLVRGEGAGLAAGVTETDGAGAKAERWRSGTFTEGAGAAAAAARGQEAGAAERTGPSGFRFRGGACAGAGAGAAAGAGATPRTRKRAGVNHKAAAPRHSTPTVSATAATRPTRLRRGARKEGSVTSLGSAVAVTAPVDSGASVTTEGGGVVERTGNA